MMNDARVFTLIKEAFPSIDWNKVSEADRALNWELWYGPLPSDYWTECEPLDYYQWNGWEKAAEDISEMLSDLPEKIYYSEDVDIISITNPEDDEENWFVDENDNYHWQGFDYWKLNPRKYVLHEESYNQVH
jgi:hypothetical protein